ncbi:MAG: hypothetical protein EXQ74_02615 [Thermoleophilia bacterium]|nr:hypothetical protein [Thermoleophilia bacterium]
MRSHQQTIPRTETTQLALISTVDDVRVPAPPRRRSRTRMGRNERMAERLDAVAVHAQHEAAAAVMAHDDITAREMLDRASAARRAASLLRAGPAGVRDLLAS